jgi:hypothetical protein
MPSSSPLSELLSLINDKDLGEVGGAHNQKGVDFQRHWAVMRMFELEDSGENDFLFLFEALQDIAVLDSTTAPTRICLYQVKKKDRKEWGWADLTGLHQPPTKKSTVTEKSSKTLKTKPLTDVLGSPIGKLYAAVRAVKATKSEGCFISNAGCDLPLAAGGNAATSMPVALDSLGSEHLDLLMNALQTMHAAGEEVPDLSRIHLERTKLTVDGMGSQLVGLAHQFLEKRSKRHAGQARALVDALLAKIGPLGAKTDTCHTFEDMRRERGYAKADLVSALAVLEEVPDLLAQLDTWLDALSGEGLGHMEIAAIRSAAAAIYRRQVMGARTPEEDALDVACDLWLATQGDPVKLRPFFEAAHLALSTAHASFRKGALFAHVALRALHKCAAQI